MSAVALGAALPVSLQGVPAAALGEGGLASLSLDAPAPYLAALSALWAGASPLARAGAQALDVLEQVKAVADAAVPELPPTRLGRALADVVRLVRANVGLEVAHVDVGGWDSHFVQEAVLGPLAEELGTALAALPEALGAAWARTTVVVWTEFGRRIVENTSLGTDHGRGGVAFVLGGAVAGGVVHADWPGLGPGPGTDGVPDLPVTTDFREIAAEVALWAGNPRIDEVLPDWEPRGLGLYREASLRVPDSSWPGASGWPR